MILSLLDQMDKLPLKSDFKSNLKHKNTNSNEKINKVKLFFSEDINNINTPPPIY